MRPLEASDITRHIDRLLGSADASKVREAIAAARGQVLVGSADAAAVVYAEGALLLREGALGDAGTALRDAARLFTEVGEMEACELSLIEASVADVRRGIRDLAVVARSHMLELQELGATPRVRVAALIVRGTADRVLGDAASAYSAFLEAKDQASPFPELKTQALNSLGTLYVVTGAFGAARSVLESAAELCHMRGDSVGESIAMGQLGAAALGLGDLVLARRNLSRQEWLARQVGDVFGRSRALVWLSEVALELGAPDDAIEIAKRAHDLAESAGLGTFKAYADRVIGRAKHKLGENGAPFTERALAVFRAQRLPLGEALSTWDLAVSREPVDRASLQTALVSLGSLGLVDRVLEVMVDLSELDEAVQAAHPAWPMPDVRVLMMTAALSGRKAEAIEMQLVHDDPEGLAASVAEKTAAKRNLARLAALSVDQKGLVALAVVGSGDSASALTDLAFSGALVGQIGSACLFVWPKSIDAESLAKDAARVLTEGRAGALARLLDARVVAPGFGGAHGARLEGVDTDRLLELAFAQPRATGRPLLLADELEPGSATNHEVEAALSALGVAVFRGPG